MCNEREQQVAVGQIAPIYLLTRPGAKSEGSGACSVPHTEGVSFKLQWCYYNNRCLTLSKTLEAKQRGSEPLSDSKLILGLRIQVDYFFLID